MSQYLQLPSSFHSHRVFSVDLTSLQPPALLEGGFFGGVVDGENPGFVEDGKFDTFDF